MYKRIVTCLLFALLCLPITVYASEIEPGVTVEQEKTPTDETSKEETSKEDNSKEESSKEESSKEENSKEESSKEEETQKEEENSIEENSTEILSEEKTTLGDDTQKEEESEILLEEPDSFDGQFYNLSEQPLETLVSLMNLQICFLFILVLLNCLIVGALMCSTVSRWFLR